ncbi:hypothetical protein JQ581_35600 [Bradyrhizobium liaoningense]|uniref:hypothetical protein n=1 Tax=Bradyrhizobium liaoningense TaxID=43992 RepID=UPI001BAAC80C|nr:hypothetical protein [Bradyrhizobium liaoningense]MBR0742275.1 hypothetical protein [Bradyrhizobium liaoningense]
MTAPGDGKGAGAFEGYDAAFESAMSAAVTKAIIETSKVPGSGVVILRTAETASALTTALAGMLSMSLGATDSKPVTSKMLRELRKRLDRRIALMRSDAAFQDFMSRVFHGGTGGNA